MKLIDCKCLKCDIHMHSKHAVQDQIYECWENHVFSFEWKYKHIDTTHTDVAIVYMIYMNTLRCWPVRIWSTSKMRIRNCRYGDAPCLFEVKAYKYLLFLDLYPGIYISLWLSAPGGVLHIVHCLFITLFIHLHCCLLNDTEGAWPIYESVDVVNTGLYTGLLPLGRYEITYGRYPRLQDIGCYD